MEFGEVEPPRGCGERSSVLIAVVFHLVTGTGPSRRGC